MLLLKTTEVDVEPFTTAIAALDDMAAPLSLIGSDIKQGVAEAFATEGASGDRPWEDLTPSYGRWKKAHAPGAPMLIGLKRTGGVGEHPQTYALSGQMERELLSPDAVHITPHSLTYLPLSDIAGFHQGGTPRMHARPPVPISERQLRGWDGILRDWVDSIFDGVGL